MEMNPPEGCRTDGPALQAFRAPLLVAAALICLITGLNIGQNLLVRSPRNAWEASEVLQGWRSLSGLPVYDISPDGHATHLYGALVPWVQGEIFRWVGLNNISGRVLTLVSALATITLIAVVTRSRGSGGLALVAWAALFGLNHRTAQYYIENRPDMTAMFFATLAIVLMGLGLERRRGDWMVIGTASLIVGFFFKQTASTFSAVPALVLLLRGRRPTRAEILLALTPLAAMAGVILYLKLFCPAISHYMLDVLASYRIDGARAVHSVVWRLLLGSPLFLLLAADWLLAGRGSLREDPRMPWVVATLVIAFPVSAMAYAKVGGVANSLLPALLGMCAFWALRLPAALARLEVLVASNRNRALIGSFAASLLFLSTFPHLNLLDDRPPWEGTYDAAIAATSKLPGTIVCPKDPTIPLYAKSHVGRGLAAELDAHPEHGDLPEALPARLAAELRAADFVLDIRDYWQKHLDESDLRGLGLVPADDSWPDLAPYRLWRRGSAAPAPDASRTAWNSTDSPAPPEMSPTR